MMNDLSGGGTITGDPIETDAPGDDTKTKNPPPKSREERIADYRRDIEAVYQAAVNAHTCCTPTRQDMLIIEQYRSPPID